MTSSSGIDTVVISYTAHFMKMNFKAVVAIIMVLHYDTEAGRRFSQIKCAMDNLMRDQVAGEGMSLLDDCELCVNIADTGARMISYNNHGIREAYLSVQTHDDNVSCPQPKLG